MSCPYPSPPTKVNRLWQNVALDDGAQGPRQREGASWPAVTAQLADLSWCGDVFSLGVGLTCFWSSVCWWRCPLCWHPRIDCSFFRGDRGDLLSRLCLVVWLPPRVCLSLCVLPVVLPYGRLRHAVLPQGRTTDRIPGHPLHRRTPRLPGHKQPSSQGLAPLGRPPAGLAQAPEDSEFWLEACT